MPLVGVARVPRDEELHRVRVADQGPRREHELVHQVQVLDRDDVLHLEDFAGDEQERQHHREAAEDRAGDEVRREDRRVPAGQDARREVERNDRVHGEDQRRREGREDQVRALVVPPVTVAAPPAEGEGAVDHPPDLGLAAVAQGGQVRDEARVPEEQRDREVGRDREDVPHERALEVRPHAHLVRDREHVVVEPRAADVDAGEEARAHDREDGHRLGEAVDAGAPLLPEQEEDGGDQRAGVTDTDPPDEVGDVPGPGDRAVVAPRADAHREEVAEGGGHPAEHGQGPDEEDPPPARRLVLGHARHRLGDVIERRVGRQQVRLADLGDGRMRAHQAISGFGLRMRPRKVVLGCVPTSTRSL